MKRGLSVILFIILMFGADARPAAAGDSDTTLRVCVLNGAEDAILTIKGSFKIYRLNTNEVIKEGKDLINARVVPSISGLIVGGEPFNIYGIDIVPGRKAYVYLGKRSFRGAIELIRTQDKRLLAVNRVDIEDYLKGVLCQEVSPWWPIEALKAQAIAARTYAMHQKSVSQDKNKDYELTSDIYSQVYGGRLAEKWRTNRAVVSTRGEVLTFNGKMFPAYYHATCGGRTEDASNLWNIDLAPLKGIKSNFCKLSPHYNWQCRLSGSEIEDKLKRAGYSAVAVTELKAQGRTSSGRVREIIIISDNELVIPANNFRLAIGPNIVRSTNFKVEKKGKDFIFRGRGWGHGVGMCQWGASFLALRKYKAGDILRHFYPGSRIGRI